MNGLRDKQEIDRFFNDIGGVTLYHMNPASGYRLAALYYYVDYNYILSTYSNGHDRIRFICYIGASDEKNASNMANDAEADAVGKLRVGDEEIELFRVKEENSPYALKGRVQTSNSQIYIGSITNSV